jgi:Flp pilus assembly protein TadD
MNRLSSLFFVVIVFFAASSTQLLSQVDEVSEATGMPIAIGQAVVYGQVAIEGIPADTRRPNIFVSLTFGGSQIERRQTDGRGYYFFMQTPKNGMTLIFEVDGTEVGRTQLTVGIGNRVRQDVTLDWKALSGQSLTRTGVVSTKGYQRTPEAEQQFAKAMDLVRQNKTSEASAIFLDITTKDASDHIALTMLGTIQFEDKKYDAAAASFSKALTLKPDFTLARVNLGKLYIAQKNYQKAIDELTRAVELDKTSADANHYLGEALLQIKKGSLAVGFLNRAIELAPVAKAQVHLRLAALYDGAGLKDRASAEYKAFLAKVPDHADRQKFEQYIKDNPPK